MDRVAGRGCHQHLVDLHHEGVVRLPLLELGDALLEVADGHERLVHPAGPVGDCGLPDRLVASREVMAR